ncbi:hypothetical protein [Streptomyces sp. NPDC014995]
MSHVFTIRDTDEDVWEPSIGLGRLFLGRVDTLGERVRNAGLIAP